MWCCCGTSVGVASLVSVHIGILSCLIIVACCYFYLLTIQSDPGVVTSNITVFGPYIALTLDHRHSCGLCVSVNFKHISLPLPLPSPETSAGMGWGVWGGCNLRGHSASGACPLLHHQWKEPMLCLCPVPYLQSAPPEGCYPGPACESPPWPWLPGAGV